METYVSRPFQQLKSFIRVCGLAALLAALGLVPCTAQVNASARRLALTPQPFFFSRNGVSLSGYSAVAPEARAHFTKDGVLFQGHNLNFAIQFLGAADKVQLRGDEPLAARINYLIGSRPEAWSTNIPTYRQLLYQGLYAGVDARFGFSTGHLKSEFIVGAGANPQSIRFRYTGLGPAHIDDRGRLIFTSEQGELREEAPMAFQWKQGHRVPVPAAFAVSEDGVVHFEVGVFDQTLPLVIDPTISYSSYLGAADSAATAVATDSNGNVYVTGWTDSVSFPVASPFQATNGGGVDAFVLKLNSAGNTRLYATYIGGNGDDRAYGIAVDSGGNAYVTGSTTSTNFPLRAPVQAGLRGSRDAFVLKLNASGSGLTFSTYLGGSGSEYGNAIALDTQGNAYVTGDTTSADFPTLGPFQGSNKGQRDAFVTKISASGTLIYSTYLGGNGDDRGAAIAVDASGNAFVTGGTFSNNFPTLNPFQALSGGGEDAFVAKLSPGGSSLVYSTYLGGSSGALGSPESGSGIAVDPQGNAYVVGMTSSSNFPVSSAFQASQGGGTENAFITKLNPYGSTAVFSTYIGGSVMDYANAVAVDAAGNVYVAGFTASPDLPLASPVQGTLMGAYDAFILELNSSGASLNFATYYGGSSVDAANGIALDSAGNAYVVGQTQSSDFPLKSAFQTSMAGSMEAFIAKLSIAPPDFSLSMTPASQNVTAGGTATYTITLTGSNGFSGTVNLALSGLPSGASGSFNPSSLVGPGSSTLTISTTSGVATGSLVITAAGTSGSLVHNVAASLTVQGRGDFSIAVFPASQTVAAGSSAVFLVVPTGVGGFSQAINLGVSGLPVGATAVFNPPSVAPSGTSTLLITTPSTVATGNLALTVGGTSGSAVHNATASLTVTGSGITLAPPPGAGLQFVAVTPCRVADTRNPNGPFGGPFLGTAGSRDFAIPASGCGIPLNAAAYSLNVTVVPLGPLGFLSLWPAGQPQAVVSTMNSSDGRIRANAAIVRAGANGAVTFFASNPTNVIVDINGYFVTPGSKTLAFYPLTPCRIADTRTATGTFGGPALVGGQSRTFPILAAACNIPATAQAYALNMTVVPSGGLGFLSAWPAGGPQPPVSILNAPTGATTANAAIVPAGSGGAITVIATNPTNLIVDINGYFAPPGASGALLFYAVTPCRILDTRSPEGPFGGPEMSAGQPRSFVVHLSACQIPGAAQAFSLNVTVVPPAGLDFLTLWGNNPMPGVSTLNDSDGSIVADATLARAASDGSVSGFASNLTHLILDINGYFAP